MDFFELDDFKIDEEIEKELTLEDLRTEALIKLNRLKANEKYDVLEYEGLNYFATREALNNYKDTVDLARRKEKDEIIIKTYEGKTTVKTDTLDSVVTLIGERLYDIWLKYDELRTRIKNAESEEIIKEIMSEVE